jgi:hypothetical protein
MAPLYPARPGRSRLHGREGPRRRRMGWSPLRTDMDRRRLGSAAREVAVLDGKPGSSLAALRRGLDLGMTHIDTAEMYGTGPPRTRSPRRPAGEAMRSSWSQGSFPGTPRGPGRSRPARGRSPSSRPIVWTPASAPAPPASAGRHGRGLRAAPAGRENSLLGASAALTFPSSRRPGRATVASPAIRPPAEDTFA